MVDLPYLWADYDHVHRVLDGAVGDQLADGLREAGFEVVAWLDSWGYRNVATKAPVASADDLKGLKIRTIPTDTYVQTINAMGANATPMAFGEIYTAMETGVLDGLEHSAALVQANKFNEVAGNYTLTRHLFGPVAFVCSTAFMGRLDEDQKAQVLAAAELRNPDGHRIGEASGADLGQQPPGPGCRVVVGAQPDVIDAVGRPGHDGDLTERCRAATTGPDPPRRWPRTTGAPARAARCAP
ncbi:hypothetical protein BW733_03110 [Tessaracoccus flavescens]|uniref:Uncharacterized protein n=1 Tax=Tessaracoccus flavescens TaxID=399497 RepID=A0A1Q2CV67_9ACTN|nr:hypothetical protein BW733_03110 [Tessaracoccus flavescens]